MDGSASIEDVCVLLSFEDVDAQCRTVGVAIVDLGEVWAIVELVSVCGARLSVHAS
jgi:hypothetical protein